MYQHTQSERVSTFTGYAPNNYRAIEKINIPKLKDISKPTYWGEAVLLACKDNGAVEIINDTLLLIKRQDFEREVKVHNQQVADEELN